MPPIEVGPTRAIGAVNARMNRKASVEAGPPFPGVAAATTGSTAATGISGSATGAAVETSAVLAPGEPPIDADRVAVIRKAVESGTYPVIPTRIADAIIAAGVLLRSAKA